MGADSGESVLCRHAAGPIPRFQDVHNRWKESVLPEKKGVGCPPNYEMPYHTNTMHTGGGSLEGYQAGTWDLEVGSISKSLF